MKIYQKPQFIIDVENKTINCIIRAEVFSKILGRVVIETQGNAICAKEDTFNLEKGKRVAEAKAALKLYDKYMKLTHNEINKLKVKIHILGEEQDRAGSLFAKEYRHLTELKH